MTSIFLNACQFAGNDGLRPVKPCYTAVCLMTSLHGLFMTLSPRLSRAINKNLEFAQLQECKNGLSVNELLLAARADTFHLALDINIAFDVSEQLLFTPLQPRQALQQLKQVQNLTIYCRDCNDEVLQHIAGLTNVDVLDVSCCLRVTSDGLAQLPRSLHTLYLKYVYSIRPCGITAICQYPQLQHLSLRCVPLRDAELKQIAQHLTSLRTLDISCCTYASDAGLAHLASNLHLLEELDLTCSGNITDAGIAHLNEHAMPRLRFLDVSYSEGVTGSTLGMLSSTTMEVLDVSGCPIQDCSGIAALHFLRVLEFDFCNFTDTMLAQLGQLQYLESLNMGRCFGASFTDGLRFLPVSLQQLDLSWIQRLGDESLVHLWHLTELRVVKLLDCPVSVAALRTLQQKLPNLRELDVRPEKKQQIFTEEQHREALSAESPQAAVVLSRKCCCTC